MKIRTCFASLVVATNVWLSSYSPAIAADNLFGAKVLEDDVAAIAVPINGGKSYNLLILHQLNNQRQCWRENGSSPTVVDPLLLEFDFTGICSRSVDSNGYSLRLAGEDMNWRYSLRLVKEGQELRLKAFNTDNVWRSPLDLGGTQGLDKGMLKIHLKEGWQLAQRIYKGKTLGHMYIAHDQTADQLLSTTNRQAIARNNRRRTTRNPQPQVASNSQSIQIFVPPSQAETIPVPSAPIVASNLQALSLLPVPRQAIPTNKSASSGQIVLDQVLQQPPPPPISLAQSLGFRYKLVVNATTNRQKEALKVIVPDAFHTWVGDRRVMQVGAFADEAEARELQEHLKEEGFTAQLIVL